MSTPEEKKMKMEAALAKLEKRMGDLNKKPELKQDDLVTVIGGPYADMKGRIIGISNIYSISS